VHNTWQFGSDFTNPSTGVLFLSPNNSPPAIAHLLTVTNATHMIVQDVLLPSATAALTYLNNPSSVTIINQPSPDVFGSAARSLYPEKTRWDPVLKWEDEYLLPITIIHSSGSTGFPKPITATNKAAISNCANFGLITLTTLPLYHVCYSYVLLESIHFALNRDTATPIFTVHSILKNHCISSQLDQCH
jgi:acyl-CoA synthetase (AMP-forming)/AMP-acid ligase II